MIKFDFTSHFIIVLCLMVILVSTLIIINYSVNSKWGMGPFVYLSKGLQSICYTTAYNVACRRSAIILNGGVVVLIIIIIIIIIIQGRYL